MVKLSAKAKRTSMRQTRDAEATKAQILDAAEKEFARHGLSGTRTDAIAAKTGVTKSMIFYHFGSKEGLYQAILQRPCGDIVATFEQLHLDEIAPEEALKTLIRAAITYQIAHPHRGKVLFHEANQNQGKYFELTGGWQPAINHIRHILERGMADESFRPLDSLITTIHIMGICSFYLDAYENLKYVSYNQDLLSPEMLEKHIEEAIALVLAGVRNHLVT